MRSLIGFYNLVDFVSIKVIGLVSSGPFFLEALYNLEAYMKVLGRKIKIINGRVLTKVNPKSFEGAENKKAAERRLKRG